MTYLFLPNKELFCDFINHRNIFRLELKCRGVK